MSAAAAKQPARIAIVTISDGVANGTREDRSGALIAAWAGERGSEVVAHERVADESGLIAGVLSRLADRGDVDVVLTTGGTGLTARDVTPEATRAVLQREAPGIAERIRNAGAAQTPYASLSRGVAGVRGSTLIVNLPGSSGGVRDGLRALDDVIDHAVQLLRGADTESHDLPHG